MFLYLVTRPLICCLSFKEHYIEPKTKSRLTSLYFVKHSVSFGPAFVVNNGRFIRKNDSKKDFKRKSQRLPFWS